MRKLSSAIDPASEAFQALATANRALAAQLHARTRRGSSPGRRITVLSVKPGDTVAKGQPLLTLEAMTMEHTLSAPFNATVAEVPVSLGGQVTEGAVLAKLTPG